MIKHRLTHHVNAIDKIIILSNIDNQAFTADREMVHFHPGHGGPKSLVINLIENLRGVTNVLFSTVVDVLSQTLLRFFFIRAQSI